MAGLTGHLLPGFAPGGHHAVKQAGVLGNDGAQGHAGKAHGRKAHIPETQQHRKHHVQTVHQKVCHHGAHAVLQADEPPFESKERKRGRSRPNADIEVAGGQLPHFGRALDHQKSQLHHHPLQNHKGHAANGGNAQRPPQNAQRVVFPAIGLGGEAARSGAQKTEVPVQQVEEHGANGNTADERGAGGAGQVSHHGNIYHAHQRNGEPGQDAGDGQTQYFLM